MRNFVCNDGDLSRGGDCRHHSFNVEFAIFPYTLGKRIVFFLQLEAFCGVKYAENAIAAGAPPGTRSGSSRRFPRPPSRLGSGHPSPYLTHSATLAPRSSCPPDSKSWRRHWSPPLFKVKLRQCRGRPSHEHTGNTHAQRFDEALARSS